MAVARAPRPPRAPTGDNSDDARTDATVAAAPPVFALLAFTAVLIAVVAFAYRPGNEAKFPVEQRKSLDLDAESKSIGGR